MKDWLRSLEGRLVLRIGLVFLVATAVGGLAVIGEAYRVAAIVWSAAIRMRSARQSG